jgi:hypothetical protein
MTTSPLPFPHPSSAQVGPVVPLPAGVRIDRFVIEQTLHQGPHGFAYRVRESGHQQPLALLECFPRALAIRQPDGAVRARQAGDAIALSVVCEAFVQDARALAAIDHPGVIKVYGVINANRTVYRLMPFVDGQTLEEQRLERAEPPTVGGLVRLYDKLLDALEALHKAGFVHGLVQPDQILMKVDDNAPVLLGMDGVAIELGEMTMSPWAAPEQQQSLRFERINASADLYMLAATMCFAATGAAPPRAEERLAGESWDPAPLLAEVPLGGGDAPALRDNLVQAVVASLSLAAAARPQRADDVRHILHPGRSGADSGFVATSGPAPLWVGAVPDRDSQWETLEGMSGPAPLRDEADTEFVVERAGTAAPATAAPPRPVDPVFAAAAEPLPARSAVRAPRPADAAPGAGRRAGDAARSSAPVPRWLLASVGGAALLVAALAWWSERSTSTVLPLPDSAGGSTPAPAAEPAPPRRADVTPAPPPQAATPAPTPAPAPAAVAVPAPAPAPVPAVTPAPAAAATPPQAVPAPNPIPATPAEVAPPAPAAVARPVPPAPAPAAPRPAPNTARASAPPKAAPRPAPSRPPAPTSARTAPAESLCGNRTQFSYLYCMQEACARAAQRNNPQCAALRRSGDIR